MRMEALLAKKILIVDDEPVNIVILEQMLRESGYVYVQGLTDSSAAMSVIEQWRPDLIVLDLMMPVVDGFSLLESVRARGTEGEYLPILVITADINQQTRRRALKVGATDFLSKPFDQVEVLLRIENLLRTRWQYLLLHDKNSILEHKVSERTRDLELSNRNLEKSQTEIVQRLAQAAEFRDDETGQHTKRVGHISLLLAQKLGLPSDFCDVIERAAPLHDVGKIGIPDSILLKPGKLTAEEFLIMQRHAEIGAAILSNGHSPLIKMAETIALTHHERWDGSGYPHRLKGDSIPIEGQIVAVADVFDALTHARPYKPAWPLAKALDEFERGCDTHYSPEICRAFMELPHESLV